VTGGFSLTYPSASAMYWSAAFAGAAVPTKPATVAAAASRMAALVRPRQLVQPCGLVVMISPVGNRCPGRGTRFGRLALRCGFGMCIGRILALYWLFPAAAIVVLSERPGNGRTARVHRPKGRISYPPGKHRRR